MTCSPVSLAGRAAGLWPCSTSGRTLAFASPAHHASPGLLFASWHTIRWDSPACYSAQGARNTAQASREHRPQHFASAPCGPSAGRSLPRIAPLDPVCQQDGTASRTPLRPELLAPSHNRSFMTQPFRAPPRHGVRPSREIGVRRGKLQAVSPTNTLTTFSLRPYTPQSSDQPRVSPQFVRRLYLAVSILPGTPTTSCQLRLGLGRRISPSSCRLRQARSYLFPVDPRASSARKTLAGPREPRHNACNSSMWTHTSSHSVRTTLYL